MLCNSTECPHSRVIILAVQAILKAMRRHGNKQKRLKERETRMSVARVIFTKPSDGRFALSTEAAGIPLYFCRLTSVVLWWAGQSSPVSELCFGILRLPPQCQEHSKCFWKASAAFFSVRVTLVTLLKIPPPASTPNPLVLACFFFFSLAHITPSTLYDSFIYYSPCRLSPPTRIFHGRHFGLFSLLMSLCI